VLQNSALRFTISAKAGIYDVKSGSEATALDGTKYADW